MKRPEPMGRLATVALLAALHWPAPRRHRTPKRRRQRTRTSSGRTGSFGGFTGQYDKAQLQRGFQVYQQVCSACHGLKRVRFRNLVEPGGPEFPEASVKALARRVAEPDHGRTRRPGQEFERLPGLADPIIGPYKNDCRRARRRTARCRLTCR